MGFNRVIEELNEEEAIKIWESPNPERTMDKEDLQTLVKEGFKHCEGFCRSRENCGEDACLCVRSLFPSAEFYGMYLEMREWYISQLGERIATAIINGERND